MAYLIPCVKAILANGRASITAVSHYIFETNKKIVKEHLNDVCFARFCADPYGDTNIGIKRARIIVNQHKNKSIKDKNFERYAGYIVNRSIYKDVFSNKSKYFENGFGINCKQNHTFIMSGITALRQGWEYPASLDAFNYALDVLKVSEDEAFILSSFLFYKDKAFSVYFRGGHGVLPSHISLQELKQLLNKEFPGKDRICKKPLTKKDGRWTVFLLHSVNKANKTPVNSFFSDKATTVGKGWEAYQKINDETILAFLQEVKNA